jgi:ABC-type spermidine/putrescine transport system permease subunit II
MNKAIDYIFTALVLLLLVLPIAAVFLDSFNTGMVVP